MEFDAIGRNSRLSMQEVEEADAGDDHGHICSLEAADWIETTIFNRERERL